MKIERTLGNTGEKIPAIGMGTWRLGIDEEIEVEALKTGLKLGMKLIDTAEVYGTESLVSKAIEGEGNVFIATKVWPAHLHYSDVIRACNASLKRLGVKCIDLYQIHWPSRKIPFEETAKAMDDLQRAGKIRCFGVSNFIDREINQSKPVLVHCGEGKGRTGTVLGAYLVKHGLSADEAIRSVREKRPGSIQTVEQEKALEELEKIRDS
jgi:diketogulonate reductase-like aldo/keto reductase